MRIGVQYACDKCGKVNDKNYKHTLSTTYQSSGELFEYGKMNYGARHLCDNCKKDFDKHFINFFAFREKLIIS